MRKLFWIPGLLMILLMTACSTSEKATKSEKGDEVGLKKEKDEYRLIITDPGFESWFEYQKSNVQDHTEKYYKGWNQQYVQAWNIRAMTQPSFFSDRIEYDRRKDYGLPIERKLYYYFRWVETELNIPILDHPRPSAVF